MAKSAKPKAKGALPQLDAQTYNQFVAGVQPVRIELGEVSAQASPSDLQQLQVQVKSEFTMSCLRHDLKEHTFDIDSRLELYFLTEKGGQVGYFSALYHLAYASREDFSPELLAQFASRNAPVHVWPFMRELALNLTQRFGWAGFMLPSFLIPATSSDVSHEAQLPSQESAGAAKPKTKRPAKKD